MQLTFENQLFGYIHCFTEINVNLLLNTSNFHRKFRIIFSLILSENAPNMDVRYREAKLQNFNRTNSQLLPPGLKKRTSALDPLSLRVPAYVLYARENDEKNGRPLNIARYNLMNDVTGKHIP